MPCSGVEWSFTFRDPALLNVPASHAGSKIDQERENIPEDRGSKTLPPASNGSRTFRLPTSGALWL